MEDGFEMVESPDLWGGRQPKYEALVMRGPKRFYLETKLPSGEPIAVQLAPFELRDAALPNPIATCGSEFEAAPASSYQQSSKRPCSGIDARKQ